MTGSEAGGPFDRVDVERVTKQAHFDRVQFIRNNIRYMMWTVASIGAACAVAIAGLSLSRTPRAPAPHHVSQPVGSLIAGTSLGFLTDRRAA
jgi:hypothetical protein